MSYSHHPHSWPRVFSCPFQMILSSASPSSFLERRQSYDLRVSIADCSQNEKHHSHIYSSSQWPCWDKTLLLHVSAASLHGLLHSSLTTRQEVLPTSSLHVCPVSRSYFSFFLFLFKLAWVLVSFLPVSPTPPPNYFPYRDCSPEDQVPNHSLTNVAHPCLSSRGLCLLALFSDNLHATVCPSLAPVCQLVLKDSGKFSSYDLVFLSL